MMAHNITIGKVSIITVSALLGCFTLLVSLHNDSENNTEKENQEKYLEQVSYLNVRINDNFWAPKIKLNQVKGIRSVFEAGKSSLENFDIASGKMKGEHDKRMASDSDVYKIIQSVAYSLHNSPDKELEQFTDSLIDRIIAAQQDDGYLFTYSVINNPTKRWIDLRKSHELYCAGHLIEAAVAWYEVTGKRKFLDAAIRFADCINSVFGPGKRHDATGHEEIELALYKLYKITGEKKYLDLAVFFVDERGNPKRMIVEKITPPDKDPNANTPNRWRPPSYMQDHLPVTQQYYAVGHAVCATYLYSSVTDIAIENGDTKYIPALNSIWNDIVGKKLYITGGIGTRQFHDEGFGSAYLLPNDRAYCETCSSIGFTFWNRRMNLLTGDAKYADLLELTLYNAAIAGVSLSGDKFFYTNPLESTGKYQRQDWEDPPCCPTNIFRFLPEIGSTIYAKDKDGIYINQFIGNEASMQLKDKNINLKIETNYPWEGKVDIYVDPSVNESFKLNVRIPSWTRDGYLSDTDLYSFSDNALYSSSNTTIKVNGKPVRKPVIANGYAVIERKWKKGDHIEIEFPMIAHGVFGHPKIEDTKGTVAMMRGPVVYCIEEIDNPGYFNSGEEPKLSIDKLSDEFDKNLLGGVVFLKGEASTTVNKNMEVRFVPYYSWANRGDGKMKVWLPVKQP